MLTLKVRGYKEAKALLEQLPQNMQKRMLLSALRKSTKGMLSSARQKTPVKSGELRRQLKIVRFRDSSAPKSEVSIAVKPVFSRTRKKGTANQYYGLFVHEGTKDPRASRKGRVLVFRGQDGKMVFARSVKGLDARPFLEDAYNEKVSEVERSFGDNLASAVESFVNKNFNPIEE